MTRARVLSALVALLMVLTAPSAPLGGPVSAGDGSGGGTDALALARTVHPCPNDAVRVGVCETRAILARGPALRTTPLAATRLRASHDVTGRGLDHAPATGPPRL